MVRKVKAPGSICVKDHNLLERVMSYYQHILSQSGRELEAFRERLGLKDKQTLIDFGAGLADGTLRDVLPSDEVLLGRLRALGVIDGEGHDVIAGQLVFPLQDGNGSLVTLCGLRIDDRGAVTTLLLDSAQAGIVCARAVRRAESVILCRSIPDAFALHDRGFKNSMAVCGTPDQLTDLTYLLRRQVKTAYLVRCREEAEETGTEALRSGLEKYAIPTHEINLPSGDIRTFFGRHTTDEFKGLLQKTVPGGKPVLGKAGERAQRFYRANEHGFAVGFGDRQYEIKGIQRGETQLKAVIKASRDLSAGTLPFELSTVDLYASRARAWFARLCADLFEVPEDLTREDLGRLLRLVEAYRPEKKPPRIEITEEEREEALRFLKNPELFSEILEDLDALGVSGEETNKLVCYLAAVSRKLEEPLSVLIQSRSAAGKSTLQDAVLSLVPEEDYVKYTRITDQALFYKDEDALAHKILAIEEAAGLGGAVYAVRMIQTSRRITVAATGKDPGTGKMRTEEYTVRGPVAVMITTTAAEVDGETASRFLVLTIDESSRMTAAIHQRQREQETLQGLQRKEQTGRIIRKHHTAQRLLRPLQVLNPFTEYLSYPVRSLRTRRDHMKYLGLIRAVAFLHQYQREIKTEKVQGRPLQYIEAALEDIEKANHLACEVLGQSLDDLWQARRERSYPP